MRFSELLADLSPPVEVSGDAEITAPVSERAQDVLPGGVFVARQGISFDGHALIALAAAKGAVAVVGEKPLAEVNCPVPYAAVPRAAAVLGLLAAAYYGYPSRRLTMIGVTGTDGKTTTATLIYAILRAAGLGTGLISTVNAILGDAEVSTGLHVTTPGAPEVQAYLSQMVTAGLTHCVIEATSHGLDQGRLDGVEFDVAVVTNITHEHLDYHKTWEAYRDAKAKLFWKLTEMPRKGRQRKIAVVNADDPPSFNHLRFIPADMSLAYGVYAPQAEVRAENIAVENTGIHFDLGGVLHITSPLIGEFNLWNLLAAITATISLEIPQQAIERGIAGTTPVIGRMNRIDEGQDFLAVVDFAHTPNSLRQALMAARKLTTPGGRVISVFGSAGLRDRAKRRMMAEVSAELADITVLTAEDPRTESLADILEAMAEGCRGRGLAEGQGFFRVRDRGRAIHAAVQMARPGDVVMVCGKGHEQSMCFGEIEYPWDDREAVQSALRGVPLLTLPTAEEATA